MVAGSSSPFLALGLLFSFSFFHFRSSFLWALLVVAFGFWASFRAFWRLAGGGGEGGAFSGGGFSRWLGGLLLGSGAFKTLTLASFPSASPPPRRRPLRPSSGFVGSSGARRLWVSTAVVALGSRNRGDARLLVVLGGLLVFEAKVFGFSYSFKLDWDLKNAFAVDSSPVNLVVEVVGAFSSPFDISKLVRALRTALFGVLSFPYELVVEMPPCDLPFPVVQVYSGLVVGLVLLLLASLAVAGCCGSDGCPVLLSCFFFLFCCLCFFSFVVCSSRFYGVDRVSVKGCIFGSLSEASGDVRFAGRVAAAQYVKISTVNDADSRSSKSFRISAILEQRLSQKRSWYLSCEFYVHYLLFSLSDLKVCKCRLAFL